MRKYQSNKQIITLRENLHVYQNYARAIMQLSNYVLQHFNLRWTLVVEGKAAYSFFANFFTFIYIIFSLPKECFWIYSFGFTSLWIFRTGLYEERSTCSLRHKNTISHRRGLKGKGKNKRNSCVKYADFAKVFDIKF